MVKHFNKKIHCINSIKTFLATKIDHHIYIKSQFLKLENILKNNSIIILTHLNHTSIHAM